MALYDGSKNHLKKDLDSETQTRVKKIVFQIVIF